MSAPATLSSAGTVPAPGALRALGGVWRLTYPKFTATRNLLLLAGLLCLLALVVSTSVRTGNSRQFLHWIAASYLTFLVPAVSFLSGAGMIRDDMKSIAVDYVFTRPLRRIWFVVFRYLSHTACLQVAWMLALATLYGVGVAERIPDLGRTVPLVLLAQVLAVSAATAFGFLCGSATARYLVVGLTYGMIVEIGVGQIPTQLSRLSMTHHIIGLLAPIADRVRGARVPAESPEITTLIVLGFAVVSLAFAALIFSFRELAGTTAAEK